MVTEQLDQRRGHERRGPSLVCVAIDNSNRRPRTCVSGFDHPGTGPRPRGQGGNGGCEHTRDTASPSPLDGDVPSVPCRGTFFLQGVVMLIEHHDHRECRNGGPHRRSRPNDDVDTRRRRRPIVRIRRRRSSESPTFGRDSSRPRQRRRHDQRRTKRHCRSNDHHRVGCRSEQNETPRSAEQRLQCGVTAVLCNVATLRGTESMNSLRRRRRDEEGTTTRGPTRRRPLGEIDDLRRGTNRRDRAHRQQSLNIHVAAIRVKDGHDPSGHLAAVQGDAYAGANHRL